LVTPTHSQKVGESAVFAAFLAGYSRPVKTLVAASLTIAIFFTAGCGGMSGKGSDSRVLAANELAWVRNYAAWRQDLDRIAVVANRAYTALIERPNGDRAAFADAVAKVSHCAGDFTRQVGVPPTARLRSAATLILRACREYTQSERLLLKAAGQPPGNDLFNGNNIASRGNEDMTAGTAALESAFLWNQPLPHLAGPSTRSRIEPRFSAAASSVAHRRVEVRCWSPTDWKVVLTEFEVSNPGIADPGGFVNSIDRTRANLDPWTCSNLDALVYDAQRPWSGEDELNVAWALDLLSHETQHIVGYSGTEAETECYAMQTDQRMGIALGLSAAYARALQVRFWRDGYPQETVKYRTKRCRNGGSLDAHPTSNVWP
jgi:hypothetical protein